MRFGLSGIGKNFLKKIDYSKIRVNETFHATYFWMSNNIFQAK